MNTLAAMVLQAGGDAIVADSKASLSVGDVVAGAELIAERVQVATDRAHPLVAVVVPLSVRSIEHIVASILGDYSICVVDPVGDPARRRELLSALHPDVIVEDDTFTAIEGPSGGREVDVPGYVAMSSGSTGGALKGVLSPWESVAKFVPFGADVLRLDDTGLWGELVHPAYDMSMTNILMAIASGAGLTVSSSLGDRLRPMRFARRSGTTHLRLTPRFIDLALAERGQLGAHRVRVWASGGDRLRESSIGSIFSLGLPLVVNTYGMSETVGFASAADFMPGRPIFSHRGFATIGAGSVGPWVTRLVDREEQSMLSISSPHVPSGYFFGSAGAYPRWDGRHSVLTGDLGVQSEGQLFCLGRTGRRVKRNGRFVDLDEIDEMVATTAGLVAFTTATTEGLLRTVVETSAASGALLAEFRSLLRPEMLPDKLIAVTQMPRLGNGKVDQSAAAVIAGSDLQ